MTMEGTGEQSVRDAECRAEHAAAARVSEQMGHIAPSGVPPSSSAVPALGATGAGGEHLEFSCSHCQAAWDFSDRGWLSVELFFPHRLVCWEALLLLCIWLKEEAMHLEGCRMDLPTLYVKE